MDKVNQTPLFDPSAAQYVLGAIMHQPNLLYNNDRYILSVDDFCNKIYNIIFGAVYNLSFNGAEKITPLNIDVYLNAYPSQHDCYNESNGGDLCQLIYEMTEDFDMAQFNLCYDRIKKFSTLRELKSKGFNIDEFYNPNFLNQEEEENKFNKLTVQDILNKIRNKIQLIENRQVTKTESTGQYASKGIRELLSELKEAPEIGIPLEGTLVNYTTRGCRKGKMYLYSAPSGGGKALPNSTLIPLYDGTWKQVGDIVVGDILIDRCGKPTKVLQTFPQGQKEVYKIKFKDGREALCNDEHLWSYNTLGQVNKSHFFTKTLREIIEEGAGSNYRNSDGSFKYLIPQNKPVDYVEANLYVHPYLMGLMLGDGSFREHTSNKALQFSTGDEELLETIHTITNWQVQKSSSKNYTYYFKNNDKNISVSEFLKHYPALINTYSYNKFIPTQFMTGSINQRWLLLEGLMDTDGSIDNKGRCSFTTTSPQLKNDFMLLCNSLGLKTICREDIRSNKYTTGICYDINIVCSKEDKLKLFRLERKRGIAKEYFNNAKRTVTNDSNAIVDIQDCGYTEDMTCFLVDNDEHLFLMNDYIVTHNTRTMVGNACAIAYPRIENGKIVKRDSLQPVLFIATEMGADEIQTLILSWISGVNEEKILINQMTEDEEKLIAIAANIMDKYEKNFIIESIPNPSIQSLKSMITNYIIHDDVEYIFYDYIFSSIGLIDEFKGINLREDVVLMMLSNTLKEIAATYNVFVMTGTQVNGEYEKKTVRNANMLRGSKAIADKIDVGMIGVRVPDEEILPVKTYCEEMHLPIPNIVVDVYKNRRGKMCDIKIFRKFDYGTCRVKDIVATTNTTYKVIDDIPSLNYNYEYEDLKNYE